MSNHHYKQTWKNAVWILKIRQLVLKLWAKSLFPLKPEVDFHRQHFSVITSIKTEHMPFEHRGSSAKIYERAESKDQKNYKMNKNSQKQMWLWGNSVLYGTWNIVCRMCPWERLSPTCHLIPVISAARVAAAGDVKPQDKFPARDKWVQ